MDRQVAIERTMNNVAQNKSANPLAKAGQRLFSYPFRPLFLLVVVHALVSVSWWSAGWMGWLPLPSLAGSPVFWHAHEMVSGFVGAAIGGFSLTAVANWTGRRPVSGLPLMLLCLFWLTARIPGDWNTSWGALADISYWLGLTGLVTREIVAARNWRNIKIAIVIGLLALTDMSIHASVQWQPGILQQVLHLQLWLVAMLILIIGGRIVPVFTGNWLTRQFGAGTPKPPTFSGLDLAANLCVAAFVLSLLAGAPVWLAAPLGGAGAVLVLARLLRWQGWRTAGDPMMWILHVGFLWLPVTLILWTLSLLELLTVSSAVHALTTGAMATMILAVASRAALGHTNRPLVATPAVTAAYLLITISALLRVLASAVDGWHGLLPWSALAWFSGFAAFAWRYVPVLTGKSEGEA